MNGGPIALMLLFGVLGLAFNVFIAFCLWRLVGAFEEISLSLAKIAARFKDESHL
jgi:hypothetical protein